MGQFLEMIIENRELLLAAEFVQYTGTNIFLTGKAGTGKTTFLHRLQKESPKRMIITAPTGVAAMNAGGVTLHSFFQLPFGPYIPGSDAYDQSRQRQFRFSKEKKQIIQSLDLLVIDEISMVRADLLDAVDAVLRRYRRSQQPFGGVQLLMIGDLHQLSPVARQHEWQLLKEYYDSVYFFSSRALAETDLLSIELKHIYRQSDEEFIHILNQVRENRLDPSTVESLAARYIPDFVPDDEEGYITLSTHNASAESINRGRLKELKGRTHQFKAVIKGDFPEQIFPTLPQLTLKEGAQVMFVRNDPSSEKLYYNGKIGRITAIVGKTVFVLCPGETEEIEVDPVSWENIKYTINEEHREIEEDVVGSFEQYPLKLAWAITIHKSQGLTFERAVIDAEAAFTHGQVYVALSRCKTLEGLVLSSPIAERGVGTDKAVLRFDEVCRQNPPTEEMLHRAKQSYQQQLLFHCFDFGLLAKRLGYLVHLLLRNSSVLQVSGAADMAATERQAQEFIFGVSENFKNQLHGLFTADVLPEDDPRIRERLVKASAWFQEKFTEIFDNSVLSLQFETDNKELRKRIENVLNNCRKEIAIKRAGIRSCEKGFLPSVYLRAVTAAEIDYQPEKKKKQQAPVYAESDIEHPELFETLRDFRTARATALDVARFQIMHQRVLIQIAVRLPESLDALLKIPGVGKKTLENHGEDIVKIVREYRKKHGIREVSLPRPMTLPEPAENTVRKEKKPCGVKEKTEKVSSRRISMQMLKSGMTLAEIAQERGFALSTIESHLCSFVESGELGIDLLLSAEMQETIAGAIAAAGEKSLKAIKEKLGEDVSYGQIKLLLAHTKSTASRE